MTKTGSAGKGSLGSGKNEPIGSGGRGKIGSGGKIVRGGKGRIGSARKGSKIIEIKMESLQMCARMTTGRITGRVLNHDSIDCICNCIYFFS